jgi:hypothetical protein
MLHSRIQLLNPTFKSPTIISDNDHTTRTNTYPPLHSNQRSTIHRPSKLSSTVSHSHACRSSSIRARSPAEKSDVSSRSAGKLKQKCQGRKRDGTQIRDRRARTTVRTEAWWYGRRLVTEFCTGHKSSLRVGRHSVAIIGGLCEGMLASECRTFVQCPRTGVCNASSGWRFEDPMGWAWHCSQLDT